MSVALIFAVILYGVPLAGVVLVWSSLIDPSGAPASRLRLIALWFATLSVLWGFAGLGYVYLFGPMPKFDYTIEKIGMALAIPAVVASICELRRPLLARSNFVLAISSWMLFLWVLQACT